MQRSDGEAIRLSARCQPWLQTPSQLLKKPWVQSECWTNHTPMVYCPPDAWVASSAAQGKPQRRCFAAGEPELIQALRQWRAGSVEAVSSPDAAVASARTGGALPAPKVTKPMTKPPTPRSIVPACLDCAASERNLGMRPCSKAQERQESFVLDLAAAFGVERGGTFLEVCGHPASQLPSLRAPTLLAPRRAARSASRYSLASSPPAPLTKRLHEFSL